MKITRFIVRSIGWLLLACLIYSFVGSTYVLSEEVNPAHLVQTVSGLWLFAWYYTRNRTRMEAIIKANDEYARFRMECIEKRIAAITQNTPRPAPLSRPGRNA